MKPGKHLVAIAFLLFIIAFNGKKVVAQDTTRPAYTIIDLATGMPIDVYYDTVQYVTINRATNAPVDFYVVNNVDTVQGMTGLIVNNMLVKANGKYKLDERKVKVSGDEIQVISPEGRRFYYTPQGWQMQNWSSPMAQQGAMKQKGDEKKGKMKDQWGTIKWKKGQWKYEPSKGM